MPALVEHFYSVDMLMRPHDFLPLDIWTMMILLPQAAFAITLCSTTVSARLTIYIITIFNVVSSAFPHSTMAVSKRVPFTRNTDHFPKTSIINPLYYYIEMWYVCQVLIQPFMLLMCLLLFLWTRTIPRIRMSWNSYYNFSFHKWNTHENCRIV